MGVKKNLILKNSIFVVHNIDKDSWQDMYLRIKCKQNIIANSSFGFWVAGLNSNPNKIVIAPKQWWNFFKKDDVVHLTWFRL